ncbi:hypothetical protein [Lederbergia lenta]|nr:hypothetical protein [Lederbergia lenta]
MTLKDKGNTVSLHTDGLAAIRSTLSGLEPSSPHHRLLANHSWRSG